MRFRIIVLQVKKEFEDLKKAGGFNPGTRVNWGQGRGRGGGGGGVET